MRLIRKWFCNINQKEIEHSLYWLSLIIIPVVGACYYAIYKIADITGIESMTQCALKGMTGIPCPGCGGTRAIRYLLHGKLLQAIYYNAFAVYCAVVYIVFFVTQTLQRLTRGRVNGMKYRGIYLYGALVILLVQYFVKLLVPGYDI